MQELITIFNAIMGWRQALNIPIPLTAAIGITFTLAGLFFVTKKENNLESKIAGVIGMLVGIFIVMTSN
jgi:predicted exporter